MQVIVSFDLSPEWAKAVHIDNLSVLDTVYRDLDRDIAEWQRSSGLVCPGGCGSCCTRFTPDITAVEAEYLSVFLLQDAPDKILLLDSENESSEKSCPLYDHHSEYHCTVYAARPLVCRLFAFSGFRDKAGARRFSPCKHMPLGDDYSRLLRSFPSSGSREISPDETVAFPLLSVYGARVEGADFDSAAQRRLLPSAVLQSVNRLRLKRQFLSGEELIRGDDNPETPFGGGFSGKDTA